MVRFFKKEVGDTHQLPPRVTPTLVTPLLHCNCHDLRAIIILLLYCIAFTEHIVTICEFYVNLIFTEIFRKFPELAKAWKYITSIIFIRIR